MAGNTKSNWDYKKRNLKNAVKEAFKGFLSRPNLSRSILLETKKPLKIKGLNAEDGT